LKPDGSAESSGDTWFSRDLPVLMETVALYDRASFGFITFQQVSERTGLSNDVLSRSLRGLRAAGYIETRLTGGSDPGQHLVTTISASARVVAGLWPSESTIVERLLGALEEESRAAPTEEQRAKLRRLREAMIETGTQLVARIIGEVVAPHLPKA
jgi:hexokinase